MVEKVKIRRHRISVTTREMRLLKLIEELRRENLTNDQIALRLVTFNPFDVQNYLYFFQWPTRKAADKITYLIRRNHGQWLLISLVCYFLDRIFGGYNWGRYRLELFLILQKDIGKSRRSIDVLDPV